MAKAKTKYQIVAEDIVEAVIRGMAAEAAMDNDDGTCNRDYCKIKFEKYRRDALRRALDAASESKGIRISAGRGFYGLRDEICIKPITNCQANGRVANVKAIIKYLEEKGWECTYWDEMD